MTRSGSRAWAWRLIAAILCGLALGAPSAPAEDGGIGDFFSHLFGPPPKASSPTPAPRAAPRESSPREYRENRENRDTRENYTPRKPVPVVTHKKVRDFVPATTTRAAGAPGGSPIQASFYIDVLGDSLAVLAADGLTEAFADKPEIAIVNKSREASGLVRDDYFDWPKAANELAASKDKINFVVIMVGVNDLLQNLKDGAVSLDPLTDRWRDIYGQRIEALASPFRAAHIPVAWVGLPPMRSDHFNPQAVIKLNEIFKEHAEAAGATYIDIWDAFADQNGQYDAFGPDVDGQNVKLRGVDGIHLTKAGSRKLAHFLEADIRKAFEKTNPTSEAATLPPDIEHAADDINAQIRREMGAAPPSPDASAPVVVEKPLAGPILSLTAKPVTQGATLAAQASPTLAETPDLVRVLRRGEPLDARPGRADDFTWPKL